MLIIVHYSEIALKGKHRRFFEERLKSNILKTFNREGLKVNVSKINTRFVCELPDYSNVNESVVIPLLTTIPGIHNFSFAIQLDKTMEAIQDCATSLIKSLAEKGVKNLGLQTRRSDKNFSHNSLEINKEIGQIANTYGLKINFDHPEETIHTVITNKHSFMFTNKYKGINGLPIGASGKVLSLLSGGIDSPVASWLMMKRGCRVHFIHFHNFGNNDDVLKTKMKDTVEILNRYQYRTKIFLVPYHNYEILSMGNVRRDLDMIMFRNFMFRFAERVAIFDNYKALVTGDNVGQVASQTLSNLRAAEINTKVPIIRPLATYDKDEIIDLSHKIGTYDISIEPYKDCCSILSKSRATAVSIKQIQEAVEKFNVDDIFDRTWKETKIVEIDSYQKEVDIKPITDPIEEVV